MPNGWYAFKNGQEVGPYSWEELLAMTGRGELKPKDLLRVENQAEWTEAAHVEGLFSDSLPASYEEPRASDLESSAPAPVTSSHKPAPARNKTVPFILALLAFLLIGGGILAFLLNLNSSDTTEDSDPLITDEDVIAEPDGEDPPFEEEEPPESDPDSEPAPPDSDPDPESAPPDPDSDPDPAPPDPDPADPPDGDAPDSEDRPSIVPRWDEDQPGFILPNGLPGVPDDDASEPEDRPSIVPRWDEDQPGFILPNNLNQGDSSSNSITDITFDPPGGTYEAYTYIDFTFNYSTRERGGVRIIGRPLYNGTALPSMGINPTPNEYVDQVGSGSGYFRSYIAQSVNQFRLRMFKIGTNEMILEKIVDVNYIFE